MKKICPTKIFSKFSRVNPGFTLIELLVVISIIGLLFTVGMAAYNNFNRQQIVNQAAHLLQTNLRLAQSKALSGEKPSGCLGTLAGYKVNFSSTSYSLSAVCASEVNIATFSLPPKVTVTGPSSILFKVLGKGTLATGSLPLIVQGFDRTNTLTVGSAGEISLLAGTSPPPTSPPTPTPTLTPISPPPPTPTPTLGWIKTGTYTVGCNWSQTVSFPARQMKFQMMSGGGSDCHISYSGISWVADGTSYPITDTASARCNDWRQTADFGSMKTVTTQNFSVGCNDGETMAVDIYRYGY